MTRYWIAVASADHARRGCADPEAGFLQVCNGKRAPLQRLAPGDVVACYAPKLTFGGSLPCQKFVSLGRVRAGAAYAVDLGGGFLPFRRDVQYLPAQAAPIHPLLDRLEFVADRTHWGAKFRFGLFAISAHDMGVIAAAMGVAPGAVTWEPAAADRACARPDVPVTAPLF